MEVLAEAAPLGPKTASLSEPLFPHWLCGVAEPDRKNRGFSMFAGWLRAKPGGNEGSSCALPKSSALPGLGEPSQKQPLQRQIEAEAGLPSAYQVLCGSRQAEGVSGP